MTENMAGGESTAEVDPPTAERRPAGKGTRYWDIKLVMIQSTNRFGLAARSQICLNPVWRVGSEGSRSEPERPEVERSEAATHPTKLDSDKFGDEATRPNRWLD